MIENPRILVAMDFDNSEACLAMADRLSPDYCRLKVGKELFTSAGPAVVEGLMAKGFDVFLDLKFHDIPNTTAKAVKAAAEMGVWMVNVHASGGERMMAAARNELEKRSGSNPLLIAVTVLTSMEQSDLSQIGIAREPQDQVLHLATLAKNSGMDGVVCSAQESALLSQNLGADFCLVTPGIRPANAAADDQRRIVTPSEAIANGSHYLVIGRPITQSEDPVATCRSIAESIA